MDIALRATELLWVGGLAAVPVALAVGGMCRVWKCRPATRHSLWCAVLASFITPVVAGLVWRPGWFESTRVLAAADSLSAVVAEGWDAGPGPAPASGATDGPAPSPNWAQPAPVQLSQRTDVAGRNDVESGARMVAYFLNRALPALLGRGAERKVEEPWPARIVNATRDVAQAADVLGGLRSDRPSETTPVVAPGKAAVSARPVVASIDTAPTVVGPAGELNCDASLKSDISCAADLSVGAGPASVAQPGPSIWRAEPAAITAPVWSMPAAAPVAARPAWGRAAERTVEPSRATGSPARSQDSKAAPTASAGESGGWRAQMRAWLAAGLAVRDSLAAVPPVPAPVWAGGAGLIAAIWIGRVLAARRLLRRASAAPADVREMVEDAAARLGLRRAPEVLVVEERVSPMIWCGVHPRLVIPRGLWRELDGESRLAVVLHELAHLRRRDHRLCWLESVIGLVYWWHPAAWWARRRVRDEADLACDAWVLSVMPGQRRAYAEALVTTKSYLSVPGCRVTPGLGVMTGRTKRLARRLTMVMTQRVAPRTSVVGAALAMTVAMAGMFVTPGLACPPEEEGTAKVSVTVGGQRAEAARKAGKDKAVKEKAMKARAGKAAAAPKARAEAAPEFFGEAPALEAMRARDGRAGGGAGGGSGGGAGQADEEAQIRRLEEQLRVLEQRLEQLNNRAGGKTAPRPAQSRALSIPGVQGLSGLRSPEPMIAVAPSRPGTPVAPAAPHAVHPAMPAHPIAPTPPAAPGFPTTPAPADAPPAARSPFSMGTLNLAPLAGMISTQGTVARSYVLPEGKLEALTELMARDDVPVVIERHPDHIVVNATPAQHEIFGAFVKLIHPEAKGSDPLSARYGEAAKELGLALRGRQATELAARAGQLQALRGQLQGLAGQRAGLEARAREMESRANEMRERAEQMREKADQMREESEQRRSERSEAGPDGEAEALLTSAAQVAAQAEAMEQDAEAIEQQSEAFEEQAEALESAAADLEDAFEEMDENIEEVSLAEFADEASEDAACDGCDGCEGDDCAACTEDCETDVTVEEPEAPTEEAPATAGGR